MSEYTHQDKVVVEDRFIQVLAYQIYHEGGGSALENWLEAERILKNNNQDVFNFLDVGNRNKD